MLPNISNAVFKNDTSLKLISTGHAYRSVLIILAILSTTANVFIVARYIMEVKRTKKFPNYLLCCIAIADLYMAALICFLLLVSYYTSAHSESNTLMLVQYALLDFSFTMYLCTTITCVLDKYLCIVQPLCYRTASRKTKAKFVILLVWLISLIPPVSHLHICGYDHMQIHSEEDRIFLLCFHAFLLVFSLAVIAMLLATCIKVSILLRKQKKRVQPKHAITATPSQNITQSSGQVKVKRTAKHKSRIIKVSLCLTIAFAVTFLPITTTTFFHKLGVLQSLSFTQVHTLVEVTTVLYLSCSLIDPCMTLWLKKEFRHSIISHITSAAKQTSLVGSCHVDGSAATIFANQSKDQPSNCMSTTM